MNLAAIFLKFRQLQGRIKPALQLVEDRLQESVVGSRDLIDDLTSHLAKAGGKRLRPLLVLLCCQLGDPKKTESDEIIDACLTVEMTHLATLYHDDVMDSAPVRRGAPAAHHIWGNNRAILAGDLLLARASYHSSKLGPEAVRRNAITFERLCAGQLNETFGPPEGADPVEFYLQVLADKTGSLVALSAAFGALVSGAPAEVVDTVEAFGEKVGVAFQIADDVLDVMSDSKQSGKTPGTDLREGVDTLPVLLLKGQRKQGTIDPAGTEILDLLENADLGDDTQLDRVVQLLRRHPVLDQVRDLAQQWTDDAIATLAPLPEGDVKEALKVFATSLINREK